jgi:hypothetical protein
MLGEFWIGGWVIADFQYLSWSYLPYFHGLFIASVSRTR